MLLRATLPYSLDGASRPFVNTRDPSLVSGEQKKDKKHRQDRQDLVNSE